MYLLLNDNTINKVYTIVLFTHTHTQIKCLYWANSKYCYFSNNLKTFSSMYNYSFQTCRFLYKRVGVQFYVLHDCFWRFIVYKALLITLGGFVSPTSNGETHIRWLTFPLVFWVGVLLSIFSLYIRPCRDPLFLSLLRILKNFRELQGPVFIKRTKLLSFCSHFLQELFFWKNLWKFQRLSYECP